MKEQYEIRWVDYYALLQVQPTAEMEVIDGAYKQLMRKYHPDTNADAETAERVKLLNEAKEVLRDPGRREKYDAAYLLHEAPPPPKRPSKRILETRRRLRKEAEQDDQWRTELRKPHLLVVPGEIDFGTCRRGETRVADLKVRVTEGRAVIGDIKSDRAWISTSSAELFSTSEVIQVVVDTSRLPSGRGHSGSLTINTVLYGTRVIPVKLELEPEASERDDPKYWQAVVADLQPTNRLEAELLRKLTTQLSAQGWKPSARQMAAIERMKTRPEGSPASTNGHSPEGEEL